MENRVVITGVGCVSPVGNDALSAWENVKKGKSGIDYISKFSIHNFPIKIAGEVKNLEIKDSGILSTSKNTDLFIQYGLIAANQAIKDAKISGAKSRVSTILGAGLGGVGKIEKEYKKYLDGKIDEVSPFLIRASAMSMLSGFVSEFFGFTGSSYAPSATCATSAQAIISACRLIKLGEADVAVAGGSEASITPLSLLGLAGLGKLSSQVVNPQKESRPFDVRRNGFVPSEGAAVLVIESYEHARKRGAKIYAEVSGYGVSSSALKATIPDKEFIGQLNAIRDALAMASCAPKEIDYINASGSSIYILMIYSNLERLEVFSVAERKRHM